MSSTLAIEHELFSAISINWCGRPLETFETEVQCIANTWTRRGGIVRAALLKLKCRSNCLWLSNPHHGSGN